MHSIPVLISSSDTPLVPRFLMCCGGKCGPCGQRHQRALHIEAVERLPPGAITSENKCMGVGQAMRGCAG